MIPYYILVLMPMAYLIYAKRGKITITNLYRTREANITIGIFFSVFTILLMLRSVECGTDLINYQYYFNNDVKMSFKEILDRYHLEIGFHLLNKVISCLSANFQFYTAVIAIISIVPLWVLYAKNTDLPYLSIAVFMAVAPFSLYFSGLRQALAMAVVPAAYYFTKNKKLIPFILSVFFASLFHQSAIVIILMYPVFWAKFTRRWLWFVTPAIVIVLFFNSRIYALLAPLMGERYYERYGTISSTGAYTVVALLFIFCFYASVIPDNTKMDEETLGLRNILFLSTCMQCFAPVNNIAMRMNYYYLIMVPIVISRIPTRSKTELIQTSYLSYIVMCLVFVTYYFYGATTGSDIMKIYPYIPFWAN